jgi:hypothetical protein
MENEAPDRETLDILKQFLGQTYGELHKIDSNIVGTSTHLSHKSNEFKRIASQVLDSVVVPQVRTGPVAVGTAPAHPVTVSLPVTTPASDPDQMEFVFDGSATAKHIQSALDRIETRLDKLDRKLNSILENLTVS